MSENWFPSLPSPVRARLREAVALLPVFVALSTLFVAVLQVINGLPAESVAETLAVGLLLATPVTALLVWPTPAAVPDLSLGSGQPASDDADGPVAALRDRYARGEIDRETFEERLDDLLATEDALGEADEDATDEAERDPVAERG
ncbi:SHOCT domain-containing protein [Haloarcula litorea]|uniref:SHOCT domain-containing protein n=1 Tax=Haloarcula litorea TaxID=3032579 RepID=UPI0023E85905|nr:SHOCT domain-containing protein [Halomicroarcula sp. GDY20]